MHYRLKINIFWILETVKARRNLIVDADMQKHLKWAVTFMKSCYYLIFGMKRQFNIACVVFEKDKMLILKQAHSRPSYEICLTFCFLSITKIFSLKTFTTKAIKRGRFRILYPIETLAIYISKYTRRLTLNRKWYHARLFNIEFIRNLILKCNCLLSKITFTVV